MENNITKISIKNSGKGVTLPLNSWKRGYGPPPLVLTFTDDPPLWGPSLPPPPPKKKRTFPNRKGLNREKGTWICHFAFAAFKGPVTGNYSSPGWGGGGAVWMIFGASLPATQKVSVPISFRTHIPIGWSFTTLLLSRIKNLLFVVNNANSNRISLNNRKYAENSS